MLCFEFTEVGAVAVGVVVFRGIVGIFEFGDGGFDGEGAVVVEGERLAGLGRISEESREVGKGGARGGLEGSN